jgi:hypothetical protein
MGIDPGFGSSAFGIVVTQWQDQQIQIVHAEEYQRPDFNVMLKTVNKLSTRYRHVKKIGQIVILIINCILCRLIGGPLNIKTSIKESEVEGIFPRY